jgi:uncharacterized protein
LVRDPREGVADDGTITTGAERGRLSPVYAEVLEDAVETLRLALGDVLHSIYVYGSVATGQARPPNSDLDLIVVLEHLVPEIVDAAAAELSGRHGRLVRAVGIGSVDLATLSREDETGHAERCFLKHYGVHLAGPDLRHAYPPCAATAQLAVGFNGDVATVLAQLRRQLGAEDDGRARAELAARACRKILVAAATLLSVREGGWSTDRGTAVDLIGRHAPELESLAAEALLWCDQEPPAGTSDVLGVIDRLGGWLADEYAHHAS